jgi:hypothetical protein
MRLWVDTLLAACRNEGPQVRIRKIRPANQCIAVTMRVSLPGIDELSGSDWRRPNQPGRPFEVISTLDACRRAAPIRRATAPFKFYI